MVQPKGTRIGSQIQQTAGRADKDGIKKAFGADMGVTQRGDNAGELLCMVETGIPAPYALQDGVVHRPPTIE